MADLPLLVFPQAISVAPPKGNGFQPKQPHLPDRATQVARLAPQLQELQQDFSRYQATIGTDIAGLEPETVLVIEIVGSVDNFQRAVAATTGLEWLGEWDLDDIPPDENFFERDHAERPLNGRLFLSLSNEQGLRELLSLWRQWKDNGSLPYRKTKWRDVFQHLREIRHWGIEETLGETGMAERWRGLLDPLNLAEPIRFQIELFYRASSSQRRTNERVVAELVRRAGGGVLGAFIDIPDIALHATKAELPAGSIRHLLAALSTPGSPIDIDLFKFPGVMYFRPTGQSLSVSETAAVEPADFPAGAPDLPPVAAILDGAPNLQHAALKDRIDFDDPDGLAAEYGAGERKHGSSMASLVVHGDLSGTGSSPLPRRVFQVAVMQPDPLDRNREHIPESVFFEDRIGRAVRRMIVGDGTVPAQAPNVRIINLSIGDPERPFVRFPSPWARLLDWLSWKYRVLFCVSAGNTGDDIDVGIPHGQFAALPDAEKVARTLTGIQRRLAERRVLSPAESINALTVGALHADESGTFTPGPHLDLLPNASLPSPASRLGHGFRRAVKPEIFFPGGRQLYSVPLLSNDQEFKIPRRPLTKPGQKVAWDSAQPGNPSGTAYTRGTSNATALATRGGARIHEVLARLQTEAGQAIRDDLLAVLIKALLVHGARHRDEALEPLTLALKTPENSRRFKEVASRYVGYGAVDIERVLRCTEQRATVLGSGEIREDEVHEYRFPLPVGLSGSKHWRRMVVTLAWFSPINPTHRNLREAKLALSPADTWNAVPLAIERQDADHNQVLRGTVQHEVLEGSRRIRAYQDGADIRLQVTCKKDATERLDEPIPYGLAVTLEIAEGVNVPIYQQIRARIRPQVAVST